MTSILITGANRGIGLEIVKRVAAHPQHPDLIIATCRDPSNAQELNKISEIYSYVKILELDLLKFGKYSEFASQVGSIVGENGLNILVNNAGVAKMVFKLEEISYDKYETVIKTNLFGPVFLTKALLPLLKKAGSLKAKSAIGFKQVAVINMSSELGSVTEKQLSVWGYNESKAALNQATRSMASNLNGFGILAVTLHPGWVKTDMGGPQAPLSVEESVTGLLNILSNLSEEMNDKFLKYDGSAMKW